MILIRICIRGLLGGLFGLLLLGPGVFGPRIAAAEGIGEGGAPTPALHRPLDRASDFAPAGVLLDHTHKRDDWTFLYRYQRVEESGLQRGLKSLSVVDVQATYTTVPVSQVNETHTFGVMYAPRDRFTVALMLPYVDRRLDQISGGISLSDTVSGIGDAKFLVMLPFIQRGQEKTQFNISLSLPTGEIRADGRGGERLPYRMQLGSGSWDIHWGLTYTGKYRRLSWGGQVESQYRMTDNALGYEVGNVYSASGWLTGEVNDWLSLSFRLVWTDRGDIEGVDSALDVAENPMNSNRFQGGTLVEVGAGLNLLLPIAGGQRLSFETVIPVHQNLDGIQLAADVKFVAGWQWIF